jgi:hypothetical protein
MDDGLEDLALAVVGWWLTAGRANETRHTKLGREVDSTKRIFQALYFEFVSSLFYLCLFFVSSGP